MKKTLAGNPIIRLNKVDSTNNYLCNLLKKNKPAEGLIVLADYQLKGRGQLNNSWESEKGKNLLLSLIWYPAFIKVDEQFVISKCISLAIADLSLARSRGPLISLRLRVFCSSVDCRSVLQGFQWK